MSDRQFEERLREITRQAIVDSLAEIQVEFDRFVATLQRRPSGSDASRVAVAIQGHEEAAEYFGTDAVDAASLMAWHSGYEAGAAAEPAFSAGYAQAERDIMDWLNRQHGGAWEVIHRMEGIGAVHVPRVLAEEIGRSTPHRPN